MNLKYIAQLNQGIQEELEHLDTAESVDVDPVELATKIAMDHLKEDPEYYVKQKMVKKAFDINDQMEALLKSEAEQKAFYGFSEDLFKGDWRTESRGGAQYYVEGPYAGKMVGTVRGHGQDQTTAPKPSASPEEPSKPKSSSQEAQQAKQPSGHTIKDNNGKDAPLEAYVAQLSDAELHDFITHTEEYLSKLGDGHHFAEDHKSKLAVFHDERDERAKGKEATDEDYQPEADETKANQIVEESWEAEDGSTMRQHTVYEKDGTVSSRFTSKDGRLDGVHRGWHPNGQLAYKHEYDYSKPIGTHTGWTETGEIDYEYQMEDNMNKALKILGIAE